LLFEGQERHAYRVIDYVLMDNHYHCIIEIPPPEEMSKPELLDRWNMSQRSAGYSEPEEDVLDEFRKKIHDLSFVVGNFEQRFVQWYNKRNNRLGSLFNRFDSVIIGGGSSLAALMAYITLNPIRAGIVSDPAEYHWCGYTQRLAKGILTKYDIELVEDLHRALNLPPQIMKLKEKRQLELLWKYFRERLMRAGLKAHTECGDWKASVETVGGQLEGEGKDVVLDKAQHFMLKVRFATKGVAIGTETFIEDILSTCGKALGYKRKHHACEHSIWDHVHSLKKHRKAYV